MKMRPLNYSRPAGLVTPKPHARTDPGWRVENHDTNTADLYIYDEIGYFGVMASDILNALSEVSAPTINVHINSPGGDVFDGIAIFNALLGHPAVVNTVVDGLAASAASFIAMAGQTVTMSPHATMMIHDASGVAIGDAETMTKMASVLGQISNEIASMYAERAGGTAKDWRVAMQAESWYGADEAVKAGLADQVGPDPRQAKEPEPTAEPALQELAAAWDLSVFAHAGRAAAPAPYVPADTPVAQFDPVLFRAAVRAARPVNHADEIRRALKGAST